MRLPANSMRLCFSLAAFALLAACGQRGALYLPDESRNVVVTPAQSAATTPADTPMASPVAPLAPAAEIPAASPEPTDEQRRNSTAPAK